VGTDFGDFAEGETFVVGNGSGKSNMVLAQDADHGVLFTWEWNADPDQGNGILNTFGGGDIYIDAGDLFLQNVTTGTGRVGINTDGTWESPNAILQVGEGGAYTDGNDWYSSCTRSLKIGIVDVDSSESWDTLDQLRPRAYEFRSREKVSHTSGTKTLVTSRLTDKGNGSPTMGFILDEMPEQLNPGGSGISALRVAAFNTSALKEAKRKIESLEEQLAQEKARNDAFEARLEAGGL